MFVTRCQNVVKIDSVVTAKKTFNCSLKFDFLKIEFLNYEYIFVDIEFQIVIIAAKSPPI